MSCPEDATLSAWIEGRLPEAEQASIESHLDTCPTCLVVVAELVRKSASGKRGASEASDAMPAPSADAFRYELGEEIARGGMGRIVSARDRVLGRPVALKLPRRKDAETLGRFERERRITARLQHPAIVPIYDAGLLPSGEPFYAMRLVHGESLDKVIARTLNLGDRLGLLPAVIAVVDALAYAHGEGVVHRDLKPQNVLVGEFGEVVVLDWGLARGDATDTDTPSAARKAEDAPLASEGATQAGEVLGTPAYMAPEQAAGAVVDARADVFGLGAILREVLAGRPMPPNPRPLSPDFGGKGRSSPIDAPADLLAIVQRAMSSEAADRYPSARELALDLKRWQRAELVVAHRYSAAELLRRFAKRNRALLMVVAAALAVVLATGGVALARVLHETRVAKEERAKADEARARADAHRRAAEELVGTILGDLRKRLEPVGRLDALTGLTRAVVAYQDSAPVEEDAIAWSQRSSAAQLAGDLAVSTGELDAAKDALDRGLRAADAARAAGGGERAVDAWCRAELRLGDLFVAKGALDEAARAYEACEAEAVQRDTLKFHQLAWNAKAALGGVARAKGDPAKARKLLEEAFAGNEKIARATPGDRLAANAFMATRSGLFETLVQIGDKKAALEVARAGVRFAREAAELAPGDLEAQSDLALTTDELGLAQLYVASYDDAERTLNDALGLARRLAARDPSNLSWQRAVGSVLDHLGALETAREAPKRALEYFRESDAISQRISQLSPGNAVWLRDVAAGAASLGETYLALGDLVAARTATARSVEILETMSHGGADPGERSLDLSIALEHLGDVQARAGDHAAARATIERAIEIMRRHDPKGTANGRHLLAEALMLLVENEPRDAAKAHVAEAREIVEPLRGATDDPDLTELLKKIDDPKAPR